MSEKQFSYTNKKGITYYLNTMVVHMGHNRETEVRTYFFSKDAGRPTACVLPADREVREGTSGLPMVRKIRKDPEY